jgi:hypothetical protein
VAAGAETAHVPVIATVFAGEDDVGVAVSSY